MHKDYNMTQLTLPLETSGSYPYCRNNSSRLNSMISFVQTIKDQDLKDMPIVMINMVLNETLK